MIDRRLFQHFDWVVFLITISLTIAGIVNIYSATLMDSDTSFYEKQLIWFLIGLVLMTSITFINYIHLERFAYPIYILSIILLAATLIMGRTTAGAKRWLDIGFISFQPSEFSKIAIILVLSKYFNTVKVPPRGLSLKGLIVPGILVFIPFILIVKEPDMGTAVIAFLIFASMVIFAKVRLRTLVSITAISFCPYTHCLAFLKRIPEGASYEFLRPLNRPFGQGLPPDAI